MGVMAEGAVIKLDGDVDEEELDGIELFRRNGDAGALLLLTADLEAPRLRLALLLLLLPAMAAAVVSIASSLWFRRMIGGFGSVGSSSGSNAPL